jgi:hypothetical protein
MRLEMSKPLLKRIHVNQHNVKTNAKNGNQDLPVFTVKSSRGNVTALEVHIDGPSKLVYQPEKPLSCGAKCWLETKSPVFVKHLADPETLQEVG